jgi:hypothetical protein
MPPHVDAGSDTVSNVDTEIALSASVSDDNLSANELSYHWEIVRGSALLNDSSTPSPTVTPLESGLIVLSLTVSDGEYDKIDNLTITANARKTIQCIAPSGGEIFAPGDTVVIRWNAVEINECVIYLSLDNGRTFQKLTANAITSEDKEWGDYSWMIPPGTEDSEKSIIKISNYDGTVSTRSPWFKIAK